MKNMEGNQFDLKFVFSFQLSISMQTKDIEEFLFQDTFADIPMTFCMQNKEFHGKYRIEFIESSCEVEWKESPNRWMGREKPSDSI